MCSYFKYEIQLSAKTIADTKKVYVHGIAHPFDPNDEIFELQMINQDPLYILKEDSMHCFSCEQPIKKLLRCEFCAMKSCSDCRLRRRPFPQSIKLENGECITGKICKVCDRKFLMLEYYNNRIRPLSKRDEDLRHAVQSYEMRLKSAHFSISEESRL